MRAIGTTESDGVVKVCVTWSTVCVRTSYIGVELMKLGYPSPSSLEPAVLAGKLDDCAEQEADVVQLAVRILCKFCRALPDGAPRSEACVFRFPPVQVLQRLRHSETGSQRKKMGRSADVLLTHFSRKLAKSCRTRCGTRRPHSARCGKSCRQRPRRVNGEVARRFSRCLRILLRLTSQDPLFSD